MPDNFSEEDESFNHNKPQILTFCLSQASGSSAFFVNNFVSKIKMRCKVEQGTDVMVIDELDERIMIASECWLCSQSASKKKRLFVY